MEAPPTPLYLPHSLPYPIQIQRLHLKPSSSLTKTAPLFTYSYAVKTVGKKLGDKVERESKVWESPVGGLLCKWGVKEGETLVDAARPVVYIQEPCTHDVQLHGLCALCGKDLTVVDYTGFSDTSRAEISMVHDVGGLTVSLEEANRLETQTISRLLTTKKLSLIVDLDQTIVHATVDPTVGEWLDDERNPNYPALVGVEKFRLGIGEPGEEDGCYYYVKMRPGLREFLKGIAEMYEMHVYTMGTRAYAVEVCKIIDPDGGLFGGRILSRDESGSMTRKSLQRLFPCDTSMVVIIDDRADVWDGSPNLVKVIPYEFFVGIGDINAAFLPKKKELTATLQTAEPTPVVPVPSTSAVTLDLTVDPTSLILVREPTLPLSESTTLVPSLSDAEASNALTIHDQISNRPLSKTAHKAATSDISTTDPLSTDLDVPEGDGEETEDEAVLKDDDRELDRLFKILKAVHGDFFRHGGGTGNADVKIIIPGMKKRVLKDLSLVFSGVVAIGTKPQDSEYWKVASSFGARCFSDLNPNVTHVVASQSGTAKVHAARHIPRIKVVQPSWLLDSVAQWTHLPEAPYFFPSLAPHAPPSPRSPIEDPPVFTPAEYVGDDSRDGSVVGEELDMTGVDWGDAMDEIDACLDETDEEDLGDQTDGDGDVTDGSTSGIGPGKKRGRVSGEGGKLNGVGGREEGSVGSPLQKRVKTSRSRKSRLKVSYAVDDDRTDEGLDDLASSSPAPVVADPSESVVEIFKGGIPPPSIEQKEGEDAPSQGGSSDDSDDEAFFASMAAEVESGWS